MIAAMQRMRGFWIGAAAFVATSGALVLTAQPAEAQFSDGYSFIKAVKDRDGAKAQPLLDRAGTTIVNTRDPETGGTALHIVTKGRDLTWTGFLIGRGADVNARDPQGETPLLAATRIGWVEGAELLIRQRANVNLANGQGETPLIVATQARNLAMVRLLLSGGANPKLADRVAGLSARDYAARDPRAAAILKALDEQKVAPKAVSGPTLR